MGALVRGNARAHGRLAETLGLGGLAYIVASETPKGPLAKYLPEERRRRVFEAAGVVVRVPDWEHYPGVVIDQYLQNYESDGPDHEHIHGANLSCRADAYWRVGGFANLVSGQRCRHPVGRRLVVGDQRAVVPRLPVTRLGIEDGFAPTCVGDVAGGQGHITPINAAELRRRGLGGGGAAPAAAPAGRRQ